MSEKTWLVLDTDVFHRKELDEVDAKTRSVYLTLLLRAATNPWWMQRKDIVPCDKGILAKATGCNADEISEALNAIRKLGMVKLIKQSALEEDGSPGGAPTLEEVQAFAAENAPDVDVQKFYGYYAKTGFSWKGSIVDWKEKLKEWQKTERPTTGKRRLPTPSEWGEDFKKTYESKGCRNIQEYGEYLQSRI